jgi:hypothetical protein
MTASPARVTADSAAATNDRGCGYFRSSEVCDKNTRRGGESALGMTPAFQHSPGPDRCCLPPKPTTLASFMMATKSGLARRRRAAARSSTHRCRYQPRLRWRPSTGCWVAGHQREGVLQQLPEDSRMAVCLADVEGFAYKEIAEIRLAPRGDLLAPPTAEQKCGGFLKPYQSPVG